MSDERIEYDADERLIKVYRSFSEPKTLVPKQELKRWTDVLDDGEDDQGRPVETVRYVFDDEQTARYNQQPVAFAGLETFVDSGDGETSVGDDPDFSVREDFGIENGDES